VKRFFAGKTDGFPARVKHQFSPHLLSFVATDRVKSVGSIHGPTFAETPAVRSPSFPHLEQRARRK
jgi:hypothetical protein